MDCRSYSNRMTGQSCKLPSSQLDSGLFRTILKKTVRFGRKGWKAMKLSFWDILASMVMLGGLALATIFINIFINPYSFINPFPPPTPVASLQVPTLTPSQRALPDVWTPTVGTPENTPLPGTYQANGTPTVTGTKFVLPSYTPSVVRTLGPMYTLTKAPVRTSTSSYKTSTKTPEPSDKT